MHFVFPTDFTNFTDFVPPSAVISSPIPCHLERSRALGFAAWLVQEISSNAVKISPCATLSRDDRGGCGLIVGYVVIIAATAAGVTTS
ncbi:hypothetical protein SAMN05216463_10779 [Xylanibacter ruminicola]|uniref:Uncharacterized protein n=1 Tax=Xylanibacter ruminicola TaxID=839 RepID=A0A1M6TY34_XYLRU|nr:hypothetical protein SAMN05216463_10779 [Xylanibacter ruminicola]